MQLTKLHSSKFESVKIIVNRKKAAMERRRRIPAQNLGTLQSFRLRKAKPSQQVLEEVRFGGKIILPETVLERVQYHFQSPMVFKLTNPANNKIVYCGVYTFDGEETKVVVPDWVMKQLEMDDGDQIQLHYLLMSHSVGQFAEFQPMTRTFLQLLDPRDVLEKALRHYPCISAGDIISVYFNGLSYEVRVQKTQPEDTIIITDCDLEINFAEPPPEPLPPEADLDKLQDDAEKKSQDKKFCAFSGNGHRLVDSICKKMDQAKEQQQIRDPKKVRTNHELVGEPDYDYKIGTLFFKRHKKDVDVPEEPPPKKSPPKQSDARPNPNPFWNMWMRRNALTDEDAAAINNLAKNPGIPDEAGNQQPAEQRPPAEGSDNNSNDKAAGGGQK